MYTVDLHQKDATVSSAIENMKQSLKLCRHTKEKVVCFIVGYGSTGGTHKIKTAILEELDKLMQAHQIKGFILGSEIDIFNPKYQNLKGREYLDKECHNRKNPGEVIVTL